MGEGRDAFYASLVDMYRKLSQIPKLITKLLDVCQKQGHVREESSSDSNLIVTEMQPSLRSR